MARERALWVLRSPDVLVFQWLWSWDKGLALVARSALATLAVDDKSPRTVGRTAHV